VIDPSRYPPRKDGPGPLSLPAPKERKRRKGIRKANPERQAKVRAETFGPCSRMARALPCAVPGCGRARSKGDKIEAAHVTSRGAGGKDHANVVGLCVWHHRQQGDVGIATFQKRHGIDMPELARRIADAVRDHECVSWREADPRGGHRCGVCLRAVDEGAP
jgi:hypothetical protein